MSRPQRLVLLGIAIVIVVIAAFTISGKDSSSTTSDPPLTVTVKNAKPVGGVQKYTVQKGSTIDLTVKSDTADEVHFHGYDIHRDVTRNGTVNFRFPATIDGQFVVELENHKQQIAEVVVEP